MIYRIGYYPGSHIKNNASSMLEELAEKDPSHSLFFWVEANTLKNWSLSLEDSLEHTSITRGDFVSGVGSVAYGLKELGLKKGDTAILFVPMSIQLYTLMAGLQRIGAIPVFLDSWARRDHLGITAQMAKPAAMISFEAAFRLTADVPELANIPIKVSVGPTSQKDKGSYEEFIQLDQSTPIVDVEQEHTALVTSTTGSSGTPKGANRTHRFLAAQHYALNRYLHYADTDADLPVFPIFSLNNIAGGVPTVIPAIDVGVPCDKDPLVLQAQMRACNVTCTTLSPSHLNRLSAYCLKYGLSMPELRRVVTGGAPISRDNLIDFRKVAPAAEIWVFYGSTEVEPIAHIEAKEMFGSASRESLDPEWADEGVNVGHIDEGLRYRFLRIQEGPIPSMTKEEAWRELEVPTGQVGELIVAGEHVCRDYYNNTRAFAQAKIVDYDGTVWHRTGDLSRLDDQGCLWIVGRIHNVITRQGEHVFPVRAEIILKRLPFVQQGAFLGMPDASLGERTLCVVVPKTDAPAKHHSWEQEIRRVFAKNGIPVDGVVFCPNIPMDPRHHSKVEYDVLRQELQESSK